MEGETGQSWRALATAGLDAWVFEAMTITARLVSMITRPAVQIRGSAARSHLLQIGISLSLPNLKLPLSQHGAELSPIRSTYDLVRRPCTMLRTVASDAGKLGYLQFFYTSYSPEAA